MGKMISQYPPGENLRTSAAIMVFQQNGMLFNGSVRPNPIHQINAIDPDQLKADLTGLIIPAGESIFVSIDDSFSLDMPFIKQAGASILIMSQSITINLNYIGPGELVQMDGAVVGGVTQIENITLSGDFTNGCFSVDDGLFSISNTVVLQQFGRVGTIKASLIIWNITTLVTNVSGLAFIDTPTVNMNIAGNGVGVPPTTLVSFVSTARMDVVINASQYVTDSAHELFFFDPNTDPESSIKIRDSGVISTINQALFQKGVNEAVTAVANNGSGKLRCTSVGHGQVDRTYTVLSTFGESTYNRTALVTFVDNDTFDLPEIDFVLGDDSGNVNRSSLDSKDPRVLGKDNPDQPNSMSSAQVGFTNIATPIVVPITTQDVPVLIAGTQFVSSNLERATATTGGQITNLTKATKRIPITFSGLIEKVGGGATNIGLLLIKNDALVLTETFEIPHSVNAGIIQISATRDFELADGDTLDLAVVNFDGTSDISVSQANISYSVES